jgi:hypothetical protein
MANENGIEMIKARKEVRTVPSKKGAAPYILLTGSQVVPHKYFKPRDLIDGTDSIMSVSKIPRTRMTIAAPIKTSDLLKRDSALIWPLEFFPFLILFISSILYSIVNC